MHLAHLHLEEFRAYRLIDVDIPPHGLRISGPNASGKSTIVEAVALLATSRSPRAASDREIIRWGSGADLGFPPYARCTGKIENREGRSTIDITLELDRQPDEDASNSGALPQANARKRCSLDGRPVRAMDLVGRLRAIVFGPEDVGLIGGPPADRRRHLDLTISQLDRAYLRALSRYNRILAQRNGLVRELSRSGARPTSADAAGQLAYWDEELIQTGGTVIAGRLLAIHELLPKAADRFAALSGGGRLTLAYRSNAVPDDLIERHIAPESEIVTGDERSDIAAVVRRDYAASLADSRVDEFRRGVTLVGPHRDDFQVLVDGVELATYGSRGQQRLAVLALKLAEADLMVERSGEPPVILLDDVLSELDPERGELLLRTAADLEAQVIITATEAPLLDRPMLRQLPMLTTGGGTLRPAG